MIFQANFAEDMRKLGFPEEAVIVLENAKNRLATDPSFASLLDIAKARLFREQDGEFQEPLVSVAAKSGIRQETVDLAFLVGCLPQMHESYRANRLPEELFWDTARDLTYKMQECYDNFGVWGTFVTFWFPEFYRLERFCLGRLQFERKAFPYDDVAGLQKGQTVYNCHIPSAGRLTPELADDAFRRAKDFFAPELNGKPMPVYCSSWMLYPPHVELFPKGSNLRRFAERFTLIEAVPDPTNHDFWRIFNRPWDPALPVSELPEDTSLRRAFKAFLMQGNTMGSGKCLLWIP